jgi:hypothetical protein
LRELYTAVAKVLATSLFTKPPDVPEQVAPEALTPAVGPVHVMTLVTLPESDMAPTWAAAPGAASVNVTCPLPRLAAVIGMQLDPIIPTRFVASVVLVALPIKVPE